MRLKLSDLCRCPSAGALDEILPFSRTVIVRRSAPLRNPPFSSGRIVGTDAPPATGAAATSRRPPRNGSKATTTAATVAAEVPIDPAHPNYRRNAMDIQMLSRPLYEQLFGQGGASKATHGLDAETAQRFRTALKSHGIQLVDAPTSDPTSASASSPTTATRLPDIDARLRLPPLAGRNLVSHFQHIAQHQSQPYRLLAEQLCRLATPPLPTVWRLAAGWTHYCPLTGAASAVPYPADTALVFDIENCVREGAAPTLACALGAAGWYSWCSERLAAAAPEAVAAPSRLYRLRDLIPLESAPGQNTTELEAEAATTAHGGSSLRSIPRLVVGHNVSYDRARIKEQYWPQSTRTRFLDTMSLHVCVSGVTSYQRAQLTKGKGKLARATAAAKRANANSVDGREEELDEGATEAWRELGSLNNLRDVHSLYCPDEAPLDKEARNIFVDGTLADIRADFQRLCSYCAGDVSATQRVLHAVYPQFASRFPHPATLAGMLELGMAYLPVTDGWRRYVQAAHLSYDDLNIEARRVLVERANGACRLAAGEQWRRDVWMWSEDWSVQALKMNATAKKATPIQKTLAEQEDELQLDPRKLLTKRRKRKTPVPEKKEPPAFENPKVLLRPHQQFVVSETESVEYERLCRKFTALEATAQWLPKRRPLLPGYPAWYRALCEKRPVNLAASDWQPGPAKISTGMQVTPKLLSLCWEGYPLHYVKENGWGFLVPVRGAAEPTEARELQAGDVEPNAAEKGQLQTVNAEVPLDELIQKCSIIECNPVLPQTGVDSDDAFEQLRAQVELNLTRRNSQHQYVRKSDATHSTRPTAYTGTGVWCDLRIAPGCYFFKLPHKDGNGSRVGNPLAKDFLAKFSENVLSGRGQAAERVIRIAGQLSYWRNNRDRIGGQTVVWLDEACTRGAIVPQVVVCGTLTRRASEPTWMTASNAQRERVGSELRGMVQAPPGYRFVGADVDSQELWIAAVLGDAAATDAPRTGGCHGATPFGWMTLSGQKSDGTDMHSVTAQAVGISRDHAKIINYARIYGAGQQFAQRLLKQFNPVMTETEAAHKARRMFALTKGRRWWRLRPEFLAEQQPGVFEDRAYSRAEAQRVAAVCGQTVAAMFGTIGRWSGGTESAMFNRLEEIAGERQPRTPFLRGRLTRPLEPQMLAACGEMAEDRFLPTRVNWVVQSGAVDFLHLMLVCMRWLMGGADGDRLRFSLSFHDEVRYLVREEDAAKAALAMHVTNLLVRAYCVQRLGMTDLPQSVAFFQSVEIDRVLRKEAKADYTTPSNPHGLAAGYGIPAGRSVGITEALQQLAGDEDMSRWPWHRR